MSANEISDDRRRVVIERVRPSIDCGRFPIKRTVSQKVVVTADIFADGHDALACLLKFRHERESAWREISMQPLGNDFWRAEFTVTEVGRYEFTIEGWVDTFQSWLRDLRKRIDANQEISADLAIGARLVAAAAEWAAGTSKGARPSARGAERAPDDDARSLRDWQARLLSDRGAALMRDEAETRALADLMARHPDKRLATTCETVFGVIVDMEKAQCSAWYELFPRSAAAEGGRHGTFDDCIARLPAVAAMGFDVLYLPPIHPIGRKFRKGKNNAAEAAPGEPGSPWAIGGAEGGHTAIHPELGTLADFRRLIERAREHAIDVALDIAFQCSPDHPYVQDHPEWFRHRPDGTIQYAENPPKKYQDIYPFDFESADWRGLWQELTNIVVFWCEQGVRLFRVDNPHTKPFDFWEFLIGKVKSRHPEAIFLSEAFTRPKVMYRLAKLGFSQSYTYFTWRNSKAEFIEYFTELTQTEVAEYFRPNLWTNTPDILPEHLQTGGRPAAMARLVLAATLGANYGVYGPAFELGENRPREPGSEEYLNSEKYEIRGWDLDRPGNLREFIARINRARRANRALRSNRKLRFHPIDNDQLLCYSKRSDEGGPNLVLVVVNLDFWRTQNGWLDLPLGELGLQEDRPYQVRDVITDGSFVWHGRRNFVELNPQIFPAHVFEVRQA